MMLCDSAQVADGKLYILGGGWSLTGPDPMPSAVAMKVDVGWHEAGSGHHWELYLEDADGQPVMVQTPDGTHPVEVRGEFHVARPDTVPEGTPIDVALSLEPDQVRLSVADQGQGIPPEQRGQLFNRFFRVDANVPRQQPGLGLGLYICRMIIKPHSGTIGVDSEVGRGSIFHFTLPRRGELR